MLQPGTHWTTLILLQQLKSNQTSHTTVSSEQKYVVAMLNTKAGLANTVLADILQNIDHEVNRAQIKTNSKRDRKCLLHWQTEVKKLSAGVAIKSDKACLVPGGLQAVGKQGIGMTREKKALSG